MNGKIGFINQVRTLTGNNLIPLGDQAIDREEKNPTVCTLLYQRSIILDGFFCFSKNVKVVKNCPHGFKLAGYFVLSRLFDFRYN